MLFPLITGRACQVIIGQLPVNNVVYFLRDGGHDDVMTWKCLRITGPLWAETTGHQWIPTTEVSDADHWYFLCCYVGVEVLLSQLFHLLENSVKTTDFKLSTLTYIRIIHACIQT